MTKKIMIDYKVIKLGTVLLLTIMWQTYDSAFSSHAFTSVAPNNIIFIVFISVALFMLFNLITFLTATPWLSREDVISVCYCTPAKSAAILVPISLTMFSGLDPQLWSKIQIPIVIYLGLQIAGGSVLIHPFRRWVSKSKPVNQGTHEVA
jgi:sodium/bile acid cotransporter 7